MEHWPLAKTVEWEAQEWMDRQASMRLEDQLPIGYLQPVGVVGQLVDGVISCCQSGSVAFTRIQDRMSCAMTWAMYLVLEVLSMSFPSCLALVIATLSRSMPLVRNCLRSSVMNTTDAMSPVGIKYINFSA